MTTLHVGGRFPHFYVIVFQGLRLQASTRIWFRCVFKSFHSGERFQKFAVTVCVFAGHVWTKAGSVTKCLRIQTNRIRVDRTRVLKDCTFHWNILLAHEVVTDVSTKLFLDENKKTTGNVQFCLQKIRNLLTKRNYFRENVARLCELEATDDAWAWQLCKYYRPYILVITGIL